jgi:apolipoprotein N-acyltransferase
MTTSLRSVPVAIIALAASAALLFLGTGLHPLWYLTWLAPLPVLLAAPHLSARAAFGVAAGASLIGNLNMWHYMREIAQVPVGILIVFLMVPACVFGLAIVLYRACLRRNSLWQASLAFPALWVSFEFLNALVSPHSTFGNLGYTQMDCLTVLQVVSLVGIWGISFCLFLFLATIAAIWSGQASQSQKNALATIVLGMLIAVIGYGSWKLAGTQWSEPGVKVGLIATDTGAVFPRDDESALTLFRRYADECSKAAKDHVEVIVLPEKIALLSDQATAKLDALFGSTAARARTSIVVGVDRGDPGHRFNEARLYAADGRLEAVYVKHHLLAPFENADQPGSEISVIHEQHPWGLQICKDMDFPTLSRRYGAARCGLMLVPAWDFGRDGWLHSRMAMMRGVENGFALARVARDGLLTLSDNRGRVLAQQESQAGAFTCLVVHAPQTHDPTLYTRAGDWFGWANLGGLMVILGSLWFTRSNRELVVDTGSRAASASVAALGKGES